TILRHWIGEEPKKLKSQLVGKLGVTENSAASIITSLESNELIKIAVVHWSGARLEHLSR
ncbi:hypothetical protein LINPERHAP1_LOCUS12744, partial [Linum perenne]